MTMMLTPHELATLILLVNAPGEVRTNCAHFNALLQYKLACATQGGCHLADILRRSR